MSKPLDRATTLHWQRLYRAARLYTKKLDGVWGKGTDAAAGAWDWLWKRTRDEFGKEFDMRTETLLRTLLPVVQRPARIFLLDVHNRGIDARIISGTRTYPEQDAIYKQGRFGNPGKRATNARGGQSNHNFGIAWDIGIFRDGKYLPASPLYTEAARTLPAGIEWGGSWESFPDRPHYQFAIDLPLFEIRRRFEAGEPYAPELK